jgi:predicted 3-demethylubiquinone-9 3-methyltransferase (glyoxalase superfamily)
VYRAAQGRAATDDSGAPRPSIPAIVQSARSCSSEWLEATITDEEENVAVTTRIIPCLWFDHEAEDAARYYVSIFQNSRILNTARYSSAGQEIHRQQPGSVMTVDFEIDGQRLTALNGGPMFTFNEAISLQVLCETQDEIDYYWEKLTAGGDPHAQQCGWLKDKYGVSWQVVPSKLIEMVQDHQSAAAQKAMSAMLGMKKIDIAALEEAVAMPS